ncbi:MULTISPECIES: beta-galactosidase [unclassified Bifidobacterium]|uniref:beta-galactosidase n=1 Tax=unclassified Bifidobacterium TaxID=2608897 RepID=UPI0011261456|nr:MULTISPECIES: beta-galactosidase [unclassified Bifidobacterium]TPF77239.1 beta-galactosidase [Bifidobacterium sp. UTCIF-1]TPF79644.1 beta-galactosidase [Bifidobacterium sp. UTCIF-24]TPF83105.1 beta-galactosidase [Bifidobacterium sp. UTCIF-3]TPF83575.1 beta-galactosidase [Bifidobacterium sp. UTCIF-36]TPF90418.1 beta-galactosidase [Bifidobacterium sp. UTBIF-56]
MTKTSVDRILFGAAYYDEYMPAGADRIETDMRMMEAAGINVIRIAESTWSTCEPQPGVFDFTHVDRALDAAARHGIAVIVGTPTYAVPAWLVRLHPDVLAVTPNGPGKYGPRQIMDIVNPAYRFYGERVIRRLIEHVASHPAVIGYQVDNETKYYDSVSPDMQALFVKYLREQFHDDLDLLNVHFGLDYWSNRVDAWEDFPDVTNSINQSLRGEFDRFRRAQVAEFLAWQTGIVRECAREDQFVTQNFDFEWRGYSYGIQPAVDHFKASAAVDITGVDIYHPTEDDLTGKEIAFGGDMTRSTKNGANYLVLETEAQGQHGWVPFPGQLRLQAYSHLASGADMVEYWHWHSIHNSFETYWKGLLSHDMEPNPTYEEAGVFGREVARPEVGERLVHLRKCNKVAIMVSNEALSALDWSRVETGFPDGVGVNYNDIVRRVYDALFELNVECDFLPVDAPGERLAQYAMIVTPALYCAPEETIARLRGFVAGGGHLVSTIRSFVTDDEVTVWHDRAPHGLADVFGMTYNQFTRPKGRVGVVFADNAALAGTPDAQAEALIELLKADVEDDSPTEVMARYGHYAWESYAAVTRHVFGKGSAEWIGTLLDVDTMRAVMREAVEHAGVEGAGSALAGKVVVRQGVNSAGETVTYLLNYSAESVTFASPVAGSVVVAPQVIGHDGLIDEAASTSLAVRPGLPVATGDELTIPRWNLIVIVG